MISILKQYLSDRLTDRESANETGDGDVEEESPFDEPKKEMAPKGNEAENVKFILSNQLFFFVTLKKTSQKLLSLFKLKLALFLISAKMFMWSAFHKEIITSNCWIYNGISSKMTR